MKNVIVYAFLFIVVFIATTYGIYTFNQKYENMFEFDFRDPAVAAIEDSLALIPQDSTVISDSLIIANYMEKNREFEDSLNVTQGELERRKNELTKKEKEVEQLKNQLETQKSTQHQEWLKSTIKLYEAMETNKAGQLLKSLPANEARELIYAMKKKKAAEILSNLDTETVKRLTRLKDDI